MTISISSMSADQRLHHDDQPQLIFYTELDAAELLASLNMPGILEQLAMAQASVALAFPDRDPLRLQAIKLLADHGITWVAWLCLSTEEGIAFNLTNYPRAISGYESLSQWLKTEDVTLGAVGITIEPPIAASSWNAWGAVRAFARGLWLARDNALYPAARDAYIELINAIRRDGHEVHVYHVPIVADDRRVGTTLVQRALDIVDLPADLDVLLCSSKTSIRWLAGDLGGALIEAYGEAVDAIAVGAIDLSDRRQKPLSWPKLRRDLLLAAQHTDTIYILSLEYCVRNGILTELLGLDWNMPARPVSSRLALISSIRAALLVTLLAGRYGRTALAWAGWLTALIVWIRSRRGDRLGQ